MDIRYSRVDVARRGCVQYQNQQRKTDSRLPQFHINRIVRLTARAGFSTISSVSLRHVSANFFTYIFLREESRRVAAVQTFLQACSMLSTVNECARSQSTTMLLTFSENLTISREKIETKESDHCDFGCLITFRAMKNFSLE